MKLLVSICCLIFDLGNKASGYNSRSFETAEIFPIRQSSEHAREQLLGHLTGFFSNESALDRLRRRIRSQIREHIKEITVVHGFDTSSLTSRRKRDVIQADKLVSIGRRRRNYESYPYALSAEEEGSSHVVKRLYLMSKPSFSNANVSDLVIIKHAQQLYAFVVDDSISSTIIYKITGNWDLLEIGRLYTPGAKTCEAFQIEGHMYILPVNYQSIDALTLEGGSVLYRIETSPAFHAISVQIIDTHNAKSISFWRSSGVAANDVILCVAPEKKVTNKGVLYRTDISCYRWQGGYFDLTYSIPASSPQALEYMSISSHNYLCVANYRDDSGSTKIYSTILRYSHKEGNYVPFQKILTYGARDCQHFRFDSPEQTREHYLAIANYGDADKNGKVNHHVKSYIFKFGIGRFVLFQSIPTYGASQMLPINDGEKFLLIVAELDKLSVYQHNGWNFVKTRHIEFPAEHLMNSFRMRPFLNGGPHYFTASNPSAPRDTGIYGIEFESKNDYATISLDLKEWCEQAVENIQSTDLTRLVTDASSAPNITQPEISVKGPLIFQKPLRVKNIFTQSFGNDEIRFDAERSRNLAKIERRIRALETDIQTLRKKLDSSLMVHGNQTILTPLKLSSWIASSGTIVSTEHLSVNFINQVNTKDLLQQLLFLDENYHIPNLFTQFLVATNEIRSARLNGKELSEMILKSVGYLQTFKGHNEFLQSVLAKEGLHLKGFVNGFNFSDVLTSNPSQNFRETVIDESSIQNLNATFVNGVNITYVLKNAVRKNGKEVIRGKKTFRNASVGSIWAEPLLSGFNIDEIYKNAVRKDNITASAFEDHPTFESVSVADILVKGAINENYNILDFHSATSGYLSGKSLIIQADLNYSALVARTLNNLDTEQFLLTNSVSVQNIFGHSLDSVLLRKDADIINGTINGIEFTHWNETEVVELEHFPTSDDRIVAHKVSFSHGVTVRKKFVQEEKDILPILKHLIQQSSTTLPCKPSSVSFEYLKVLGNAEVTSVNGVFPKDWVDRNDPDAVTIDSTKHFYGNVTFSNVAGAQNVYSSKIMETEVFAVLQIALLNGTDQVFPDTVRFEDTLVVSHISALQGSKVRLDGILFEDILVTKPGQQVHVNSNLKSTTAHSLEVEGNAHAKEINGIDINKAWADTFRTISSGKQVLQGKHDFKEGLFLQDAKLFGQIGPFNLDLLMSNIVLNKNSLTNNSDYALITGALRFNGPVTIKDLGFTGELNGITPDQWGSVWLTKSGNQDITTGFRFQGDFKVEEPVVINSKVSGFDILELNDRILRKNQQGAIKAAFFDTDINLGGDMCSNNFNGFNPREDFLLKSLSSLQVVTGRKGFLSDWEVTGNLEALDIPYIKWENLVRLITGNSKESQNLNVHGNCLLHMEPSVPETINDFDWSYLLNNIWFRDQNATFQRKVNFDNVHFPAGVVLGKVDYVDINDLEEEYLSLSRNQSWSGYFTFDGRVCARKITAKEVIIKNGTLNSIEIEIFPASVLLQNVDQIITTPFALTEMHATSLNASNINGLNFCQDFIRIHEDNLVSSTKNVKQVDVEYLTLSPQVVVNGVDLLKWRRYSTLIYGDFSLEGDRNFQSVHFKDLSVTRFMDGETINPGTVMRLSDDQSGNGSFTFDSTQAVGFSKISVYGNVNRYNLNDYFDNLVTKEGNRPINLYGGIIFEEDTSMAWMRANGSYQQNGTEFEDFLDNYSPLLYTRETYLQDKYDNVRNATMGLIHIATERAVFSQCFQNIDHHPVSNVTNVKVSQLLNQPMIVLIKEETNGQQLTWKTYNVTIDKYQQNHLHPFIAHGTVVDVTDTQRGDEYFVFMSVSSKMGHNVTVVLPVLPAKSDFLLSNPSGTLSKAYVLRLTILNDGTSSFVIHQVAFADIFGKLLKVTLVTSSGSFQECVLFSAYHQNSYSARSFCFSPSGFSGDLDNSIHFTQKFHLNRLPLMTSMVVENKTLLIMSDDYPDGEGKLWRKSNVIRTWIHELDDNSTFVEEDQFPVVNVVGIDSIQAPNYHPFLAVVSGALDQSVHKGLVYIYKYSIPHHRFTKFQTVVVDNPVEARFQRIEPSDELFLYILTTASINNIKVFVFKGVAGWNEDYVFTAPGAASLETSEFFYQNEYRAHTVASNRDEISVYDVHFNGNPYIPTPK